MSSKLNLLLGGLVGSTTMSGILLVSPWALADTSTVSTATVIIPTSCSMTANVDSEHTASLINGIYSGGNDYYPNGIGKTTLTAFCNDASGFAIYAVGFSGDEYGATNMIGTNTGTTIPTGTATSGANSQWAMKLTKVTDTSVAYNPANMTITNGYDDYSAVPNDYDKVATFSSATDQTLGAKLTTTYAAYISNTQPADTYTGKVKYTLVHPATSEPNKPQTTPVNKIGYFPNAEGSVEDTMGDQSIGSSATSAVLWASNFKRPGYGFAGWSDAFDYVVGEGSESNPNAHIYGPNQTIEFTAGQYSTKGLSLYAVWVPSAGSLQNWSGCSSLTQGAVTALTDQRDNNTYAVAKLADGKCWMIENLRLDNTNSDNATGALAQGYGTSATYGNFIGLANPETANFAATGGTSATDPTEPNSIYYAGTLVAPATVDISQTNYASYRMPRYRNDNTNATVANMTGTSQNIYSYGNYYSWPAAKANTDYLNTLANSNATNTSICPKGWKLPRGGNKSGQADNDFWSLVVTGLNNSTNPANYDSSTQPYYTGTEEAGPVDKKLRTFPNNFVYSGYVNVSSVVYRGSYGYYWSATASSLFNAYYFSFYGAYVYPGTNDINKYVGRAVRCLVGS
ncbi:hypothetical protein IKX73_01450 [Candidatus Saccharibacteria bacterium]|nr:hypothetical protein [Candidatus Saccharibacteria bacterium]